jgi:hypothetical protein
MTKELDELELTDSVVDFVMMCQKYGARNMLYTLRYCDKAMFEEIKNQITRLDIPVLLIKDARRL